MEVFIFILTSTLLGVGLAVDAFCVSVVNGLNFPKMKFSKECLIGLMFAGFQALMPLIGWFAVHTIINYFEKLSVFIPYIALALLLFIGIKMIIEGVKKEESKAVKDLAFGTLLIQAIATSIDALSVGFTIADYSLSQTLWCVLIISIVTFALSIIGVKIGKVFGEKFNNISNIIGGIVLILIGLEIFITSFF